MARFVLVEASPWRVEDGVVQEVRLAGGGERAYDHRGFKDWRSGVASLPRYVAGFQYGEQGWTGAAVPQVAPIEFRPYSKDVIAELVAPLNWIGATVTIRVGDDALATPVYLLELTGTIRGLSSRDGALILTVADLAAQLDEPVITKRFAGTGGLEGIAEAEGRPKRRTFGFVRNVEGLVLDKARNIYEFGDPAVGLASFPVVRDKGRQGSIAVLAWQGSTAATFEALKTSTPADGGCVAAPSIACVKWWTVPAGPLTADIQADVTGGSNKPADVAKAVLASVAGAPGFDTTSFANINTVRTEQVGIHVDGESETAANVMDRLFIPLSVIWSVDNAGLVHLGEIRLTTPVETIAGQSFERVETYRPAKSVKVGYRKNHRQHNAGEISAAVEGLSIDDLGALATQDVVDFDQVVGDTRPEPNADVSTIVATNDTDVIIQFDSAGDPKAGQLPREVSFKLLRNGATVIADTWEYRVLSGSLNGFTASNTYHAMSSALAISGVGPVGAALEVRATYLGVVRPPLTPFVVGVKQDTAASTGTTSGPIGGGGGGGGGTGGTSSQRTSFDPTTTGSTTYGSSVNALPNITTGTEGKIRFAAILNYSVAGTGLNAEATLFAKFMYRVAGAATWIDAHAEVEAQVPASRTNEGSSEYPEYQIEKGYLTFDGVEVTVSADAQYEVAITLRDNSSLRSLFVTDGVAIAQGL